MLLPSGHEADYRADANPSTGTESTMTHMSFMRERRDRHASAALHTGAVGAFFSGGCGSGTPGFAIAGSVVVVSPVSIRPMNRRTKSGSQTDVTYMTNKRRCFTKRCTRPA
jgi:hypothetical protein